MANSLINAYVKALCNKNRIIASLLLHDADDVIMETIDVGMAGEILDEYQRRALEMGHDNMMIHNSPIKKQNDKFIRLGLCPKR